MQLVVNQREKPVEGGPIAFAPNRQQFRDLARLGLHFSPLRTALEGIITEKT
jgi:hypothetical protein